MNSLSHSLLTFLFLHLPATLMFCRQTGPPVCEIPTEFLKDITEKCTVMEKLVGKLPTPKFPFFSSFAAENLRGEEGRVLTPTNKDEHTGGWVSGPWRPHNVFRWALPKRFIGLFIVC